MLPDATRFKVHAGSTEPHPSCTIMSSPFKVGKPLPGEIEFRSQGSRDARVATLSTPARQSKTPAPLAKKDHRMIKRRAWNWVASTCFFYLLLSVSEPFRPSMGQERHPSRAALACLRLFQPQKGLPAFGWQFKT